MSDDDVTGRVKPVTTQAPRQGPAAGRLVGRSALVTGGTRGIGAAVVRTFVAEGAAVVFCGRDEAAGRALEQELHASGGVSSFRACDVRSESEVRALIDFAVATNGGLDIVVNAAGVSTSGNIETTEVADWTATFDANVTGTFLVCKHALGPLRASDTPAIVNLGSTYSFIGVPGSAAYSATKAAVVSLTRSLALEVADEGIRVNALCPGATRTQLNIDWLEAQPNPDAALAELTAKHPIGRLATPAEQARACLFLVSEDASYVTGATLLVDGGRTAG